MLLQRSLQLYRFKNKQKENILWFTCISTMQISLLILRCILGLLLHFNILSTFFVHINVAEAFAISFAHCAPGVFIGCW